MVWVSTLLALLLSAAAMLIAAGEPQIATHLALAMLALVLGARTVSRTTGLQAEQVHERPDEVWRG